MSQGSINNFVEWDMTSWKDAIKLANMLPENWIFRGQEDYSWRLTTSLERNPKAAKRNNYWRQKDAEGKMLEEIKRKVHLFLREHLETYDDIDWLAILQHHGAVTRLLDFTESFYAAVFFAVEKSNTDSVVWALDRRYLGQSLIKKAQDKYFGIKIKKFAEEYKNDFDLVDKLARVIAKHIFEGKNEYLGVMSIKPWHLNERMIIQQGLSLFPLGLSRDFEFNLCHTLGITGDQLPSKAQKRLAKEIRKLLSSCKPMLIKIKIPNSERYKILFDLKRMNITATSLFPGLDGFARSLNYYASGYRAIDNQPRST